MSANYLMFVYKKILLLIIRKYSFRFKRYDYLGIINHNLNINKKTEALNFGFVPKTGFEPAHRLRHYHLKVACLPISPPGHN